MIRTIAVCAGDTTYARAAQEHAIRLAKGLNARLRAVSLWDSEASGEVLESGEDLRKIQNQSLKDLVERVCAASVPVKESTRGDGILNGLLAEARESDLLVVGLPTEAAPQDDDVVSALLDEELPVLRKAECSVLVVSKPPKKLERLMVVYHGGIEGKAALRCAGELGARHHAAVTVFSSDGDIEEAAEYCAAAEAYLEGFDLPSIQTTEQIGVPESKTEILDVAESVGADMIVIGEEPYGFLDRFLGRATAEGLALATHRPVLIAR